MSDETAPAKLEPLPALERRVLGVLIEKQKTSRTPDAYPMTLNSLTTGCNQKSNRDPVLELSDDDVEEVLSDLQKKGLVTKITGGRADRYRHMLYETWRVSKVEMAILAELLLRGPQSEGDLRGRASRMDDIADLDVLRELLKAMVPRGLIVYLTPPGRGATLTHGFHAPGEVDSSAGQASRLPIESPVGRASSLPIESPVGRVSSLPSPLLEAKLNEAFAEIAELKERVAKLEAKLGG